MQTLRAKITGATPLMFHNNQLANPFNKYTIQLDQLNKQKKQKGGDAKAVMLQMARVEWEGGLHFAQEIGPYIPADMLRAGLVAGAKLLRGGRTIERAVFIPKGEFALQYKGPRDIEGMWKAGDPIMQGWDAGTQFIDQRIVTVGMAKVVRTRPVFKAWSVNVEICYDEAGLKVDDLIRYLTDAGKFEGFGDNRRSGYGRFDVKVL